MMTSMASQAPAGAVPDMEVYVEVMHAHVEAMADLVRRECEDVKALVCMCHVLGVCVLCGERARTSRHVYVYHILCVVYSCVRE